MIGQRQPTRRGGAAGGAIRRGRFAHGMTMLEVVFAVVLLGLTAVVMADVIAYIHAEEVRRLQKLGATELCNRVLLQYMDDKSKLTGSSHVFNDGMFTYRWDVVEHPVTMLAPDNPLMVAPTDNPQGARLLSQTRVLEAKVYRGIDDGVGGIVGGEQLASLTRLHNTLVLSGSRNPDWLSRLLSNPDFQSVASDTAMGINTPTSRPQTNTTPSTPTSPTTPAGVHP